MSDFLSKLKSNQLIDNETRTLLLFGSTLEILRDLKERIEILSKRVEELEKIIEDKIPERALSERLFFENIMDGEEILKRILNEIKQSKPIIASPEKLSIVEQKRIERIVSLLTQHGQLSSSELARLLDLSRTRCNEYFKIMERLGLVKSEVRGREKYYKLK